jgi:hypothetical protein
MPFDVDMTIVDPPLPSRTRRLFARDRTRGIYSFGAAFAIA